MKYKATITKKAILTVFNRGNIGKYETIYQEDFYDGTIQAAILRAARFAEFDPSALQFDQEHHCFCLVRIQTQKCVPPNPIQEDLWKRHSFDLYTAYYFIEVQELRPVPDRDLKYIRF